jgi:hypothetical protein
VKTAAEDGSSPLSRVGSFLPVFIDAEPPDLRFERLPWNSKLHGCPGWPRYAAMALGKSHFDHLQFTLRES